MENVSRGTMAWRGGLLSFVCYLSACVPAASAPAGSYAAPTGCPAAPLTLEQDLSHRRPNEARYPVCVDQRAVLAEARERARRDGKVLMIHFGAPWCPVCRSLPGELAALRTTERGGDIAAALAGIVEVSLSLSVIVSGRRHEIAETHAILAELSLQPNVEPLRAIPYIVMTAPDGSRAVGRNLEDLQGSVHDHVDRGALGRSLIAARQHILEGTPAPVSPGWFTRRLRKLGL